MATGDYRLLEPSQDEGQRSLVGRKAKFALAFTGLALSTVIAFAACAPAGRGGRPLSGTGADRPALGGADAASRPPGPRADSLAGAGSGEADGASWALGLQGPVAQAGLALAASCLIWLAFPWLLGTTLKCLIERVDRVVLSVDVHLQSISISLLRRSFVLEGVVIENPAGFSTPYLLKIDKVECKVNVWSTMCSKGTHIDLAYLNISSLDIMCEYQSFSTTTNLQVVQNFIDAMAVNPRDPYKRSVSMKRWPKPECVLHEVLVQKIMLHIRMPQLDPSLLAMIPHFNVPFQAASLEDIYFYDFAKEQGVMVLNEVMRFFVRSILKHSITSTTNVSQQVQKSMEEAVQATRMVADSTLKSVEVTMGHVKQQAQERLHHVTERLVHVVSQSSTAPFPELALLEAPPGLQCCGPPAAPGRAGRGAVGRSALSCPLLPSFTGCCSTVHLCPALEP